MWWAIKRLYIYIRIYIYILKKYMSIKHQKKRDNTFVLNLSVKKRRGKLKIQRGEERHTGVGVSTPVYLFVEGGLIKKK